MRDTLGRPFWLASADPAGGCYYSAYFPDGLPGSRSRCNGSATWVSRDGVGRLNGLGLYYGTGGAGDVTWLYDHNPASQIRSVSRDNDSYAWTGHYAVNRAYATNGLNQYTAAGQATFGYDANGNLTGDGSRTYVYDVENRLVSSSNGAALAYDPLGRLYQVTASDGTITRFLYDGDALVAEYDSAGAMTRRYVHWDGADVPIISYTGAALTAPSYLHADHQGSIVAISGASGASQINRYDEYGIPAAANSGRFQYTGQIWLAELGLYYYKARLYSPTLGRFWQTDLVGYEGGTNLYAYVGDDPVNRVDPDGQKESCTGSHILCPEGGLSPGRSGSTQQFAQARPGIGHNRGPVWRAQRRPGTPRIGAGGLRAQETLGGPHTYRVHIGKTNAFLRGRIEGGLTRASTFTDEMMANAALTAAVQVNACYINAWLTSEAPTAMRIDFVSPISVGRVMDSRFRVEEGYRAVFVLSPYGSPNGGDFTVITGWVEPR